MAGDETLQKHHDDSESSGEDEDSKLILRKLTPLSPEVISKQVSSQITAIEGTIGHVAHGKSTVVKAISGNELVRNITIKLGYANAKNAACPRPGCYRSYRSDKEDNPPCERPGCGHRMRLVRHVSLSIVPDTTFCMATMLNGAAVMDAALLLVAGNETCPQPQTSEHLRCLDLIKESQALEHQKKYCRTWCSCTLILQGTVAESSPIVPISAQLKYNIDAVNEYIVKRIPIPVRDFTSDPRLIVIRSFDVNKPGAEVDELKGGVAGGSILTGVLRLGTGSRNPTRYCDQRQPRRTKCQPIFSRIMSLHAENNLLQFAVPGGLIGVRADRLVGQVLGAVGKLPKIYTELEINLFLLRRLLGVKTEDKKQTKVSKLTKNELAAHQYRLLPDLAKIQLTSPACTEVGEKVALSRRIENHWRLVGWGSVQRGTVLEVD
ncbi:hypothetical protein BT96DRAFT_964496 [Gymnopus androsaceus JB14]|uniref:Initiation factor eIF2 gamma C-terminal domain-containing protein n=1 Tax=Gymnopus androsaceus JB14 TaxID=1447944 RepID=A0A6A4I2I3_9AGAR|nr:hypothetical protein BT96DRAFT_964496 [Gymnopus androsaceus JB14]